MKKKVLILILISIFISCSSSSEEVEDIVTENNSTENTIIGIWKPIKNVNKRYGKIESYVLSECQQKSRLTFKKDGTFIRATINSDCEQDTERTYNGIWKFIESEKYSFIPSINIGASDDSVITEIPDKMIFSNEGEEMTLKYEDFKTTSGNTWEYYTIIFERIE